MSSAYVLSSAAELDLRDIVRYTRKEWGDIQARRYLAKLKDGIEGIASGQGHFRTVMSEPRREDHFNSGRGNTP